jgi:hypothetical protein
MFISHSKEQKLDFIPIFILIVILSIIYLVSRIAIFERVTLICQYITYLNKFYNKNKYQRKGFLFYFKI